MKITQQGPGDPATWPAYSGHPNDPRAEDESDDIASRRLGIECAIADLKRAEEALDAGDVAAADKALAAAKAWLE